jgi:hypothetical protein
MSTARSRLAVLSNQVAVEEGELRVVVDHKDR